MVFWIECIIFPFFYNHLFVAEQCCDLYRLVITEFYTLQSVTLFQAFYIIIVIADVALAKTASNAGRCTFFGISLSGSNGPLIGRPVFFSLGR